MQRRLGLFCATALLAGSTSLLAQTGAPATAAPSTQPPSPDRAAAQAGAQGTATVSGCLRTMRADTSVADPKGQIYTIEVVKEGGAASDERGTPVPGTAAPLTYTLNAAESVGLAKHVGHYVQLTGRVRPVAATTGAAASGTTGTAKPATGAATTSAAPGAKPGAAQTFDVTGLKMIAAKCPV
jgi:hypothetical protein